SPGGRPPRRTGRPRSTRSPSRRLLGAGERAPAPKPRATSRVRWCQGLVSRGRMVYDDRSSSGVARPPDGRAGEEQDLARNLRKLAPRAGEAVERLEARQRVEEFLRLRPLLGRGPPVPLPQALHDDPHDLATAGVARFHRVSQLRIQHTQRSHEDRKSTRLNSSHVAISYA